MSVPDPDPADLIESLTYLCLEAWARGGEGEVAELLEAQAPEVHAKVSDRLATLRRVGLGGGPEPQSVPQHFGPFQLLARIGAGSMGVVYRAVREGRAGDLALKLLQPGLLPVQGARLRFRREVAALRELAHPAICPILEDGEHDGVPYLVMPLVPGVSLREWLHCRDPAQAVDRSEVLAIAEQLAEALHHAHERGFVHRDVKPANVVVQPDGRPVLLDFGLAQLDTNPGSGSGLTVTGAVLGTPAYMAPEQVAGSGLDRRCDVYALGAILYEALTGTLPHSAPTRASLYRRILSGEVQRPSARIPHLSRDLDVVCLTALERDPERRYVSASAFGEDLRRVRTGLRPSARLPGVLVRTVRWARRNPLPAVLLVGLSAALFSIVLLAARLQEDYWRESARALAQDARSLADLDWQRALEMALQSHRRVPSRESLAAIQAALAADGPAFRLPEHRSQVVSLQFAAEGECLMSAEVAGIIRCWNPVSRAMREMRHGGALQVASLAPRGGLLATAGQQDGRVCVFDRDTGAMQWERLAHPGEGSIHLLSWSPDGSMLITGSSAGRVGLWTRQGKPIAAVPSGSKATTAASWIDLSGFVLGTGCLPVDPLAIDKADTEVVAWTLVPGPDRQPRLHKVDRLPCRGTVQELIAHPKEPACVLVVTRTNIARLWRIGQSADVVPFDTRSGRPQVGGGFLADGRLVYAAAAGGRVVTWELTGRRWGENSSGVWPLHKSLAHPDGRSVLITSDDGVQVVNELGTAVRAIGRGIARGNLLAVSRDGSLLAAAGWDGRILGWRWFDPRRPMVVVGRNARAATWLPDRTVVAGGFEGLRLLPGEAFRDQLARTFHWDPRSGVARVSPEFGLQFQGLWSSAGGSWLAAVRGSRMVFELEFLRREGTDWVADGPVIDLGQECLAACVAGEGAYLITCMSDGRLLLWEAATRKVVRELRPADSTDARNWQAVAATPDAGLIWAGGTPGRLHRFERGPGGEYVETVSNVSRAIQALAVLPDRSLLLAGAAGLLERRGDGGQRIEFRGSTEAVQSLAWTHRDGEIVIASGGQSGTLRLWDQAGQMRRELPGHSETVTSLRFSDDGAQLLSGSLDGTVRTWWTDEADLLRAADQALKQ